MTAGYCTREQLGLFILDLPSGKSVNETTFWSARVQLPANKTTPTAALSSALGSLWNNPAGNPTPPSSPFDSPFRRRAAASSDHAGVTQVNANHILSYSEPIHYPVPKTGFYCVGKKYFASQFWVAVKPVSQPRFP